MSPASQIPSPSKSAPSSVTGSSIPFAHSSQPSPSASTQIRGLLSSLSSGSRTPSLSSSASPRLQMPSKSLSAPSLAGSKLPLEQSSQLSPSVSEHNVGSERLLS